MRRNCYYVVQQGGTWTVRPDQNDPGDQFPSLASACDAARVLARTRWKLYGYPSSVSVQDADGHWTTVEEFGNDGKS